MASIRGPLRDAAAAVSLPVTDIARVEAGKFWSLEHGSPPEGEPAEDPGLAGEPASGGTAAGAAAPDPDPSGELVRETAAAFEWIAGIRDAAGAGAPALAAVSRAGIEIVTAAVRRYRDGGSLTGPRDLARLSAVLDFEWTHLDALAQMDPGRADEHTRLWLDVTRAARPGCASGPASLLLFTALQSGREDLAEAAAARALNDSSADAPGRRTTELLLEVARAGYSLRGRPPYLTRDEVDAVFSDLASARDQPENGREPGR